MKQLLPFLLILLSTFHLKAQSGDCIFKKPILTIHFGSGNVRELNSEPTNYRRVSSSCPTDGHYTYTSYTSNCFSDDWQTVSEDHTPGDNDGNMMLVNASPRAGVFLTTTLNDLKPNTFYEFSVWMMNVCKITEKCPFPLLPNISIRLETPERKVVAQLELGDLARREAAIWTPYRILFTTPSTETPLILVMVNNAPGGCGNDFALDDISFRECEKVKPVITSTRKPPAAVKQPVKAPPVVKAQPKTPAVVKTQPKPPVVQKPQPATQKPVIKKDTVVRRPLQSSTVRKNPGDSSTRMTPASKPGPLRFAPPPTVMLTRSNPVIQKIETEAGEIRLDLYDNGQIDGDTVTIYHNNVLQVSKVRLSAKPITLRITVNEQQPHHELVMVAENLGSIPPNTSLMVLTAGSKRYEVFISSSDKKNAKIIIDLKQ